MLDISAHVDDLADVLDLGADDIDRMIDQQSANAPFLGFLEQRPDLADVQVPGGQDEIALRDEIEDELEFIMKRARSEEHTSELQSLMRISYAVFCLKKKNTTASPTNHINAIRTQLKRTPNTATEHK